MNKKLAIEVNNISKKFCKNSQKLLTYGLQDISRGFLGFSNNSRLRKDEFWALKDVSFQVNKGEVLGIIGVNGSGKSTLLKLLNGIFMPDKGRIKVRGKVGALIAAGAGFHPTLTGRENIFINAAILGMSKKETDEKFDQIVKFADISDFLETPVKNYSSGMYVRLGFAIAIHCLPDILLVDEILSVGDMNFQKKSLDKMRQIAASGRAIIFVSHDIDKILSFTQRAIYLKDGQVKAIGKTSQVAQKYLKLGQDFKKKK